MVVKNKNAGKKPANDKKPTSTAKPEHQANGDGASEKILYPKKKVEIRSVETGNPITEEQAMEFLGWEVETEQNKFGTTYLLIDEEGRKVRCHHNTRNRDYVDSWRQSITQVILKRQWRLNMENIIISKTGQVLSGQHRLIAFVLACQIWRGMRQKLHWQEYWKEAPVLESTIAFGCEETHDVISTLDCTKPRTLSDVLFTSDVFHDVPKSSRKTMSRMIDYALRLLWDRTGAKDDAFAPRRTHQEAMAWIERHPTIKKAVKVIFEEDGDGTISKFISPGYATGMLYLMAACESNIDEYTNCDPEPSEKAVSFTFWDQAVDFWTQFAMSAPKMMELRYALAGLTDPETGAGATVAEKLATYAKAWTLYTSNGAKFPEGSHEQVDGGLRLHTKSDGDGNRVMLHPIPTFDGIDLGNSSDRKEERREKQASEKVQAAADKHNKKAAKAKDALPPASRDVDDSDDRPDSAPGYDPEEEYNDQESGREPDEVDDEQAAAAALPRRTDGKTRAKKPAQTSTTKQPSSDEDRAKKARVLAAVMAARRKTGAKPAK